MNKLFLTKIKRQKGIITIEASLITALFVLGYILINYLALSVYTESTIKKALNSMTLDLTHYSLIMERAGLSGYLTKSSPSSLLEQLSKIDKTTGPLKNDSLDDSFIELKKILLEKGGSLAKESLYNIALRKLISEYLGGPDFFENRGIRGGISGLDFSKSSILDEGNMMIKLNYIIELPSIRSIKLDRKIEQTSFVATMIEPNKLFDFSEDTDEKKSIWQESNFTRGKYFAGLLRDGEETRPLDKSLGIDFYNQKSNTLSQFHSMNVFSKSYSENSNQTYKLKIEGIKDEFERYIATFDQRLVRLKGQVKFEDGEVVSIKEGFIKRLVIVMPLEARQYPELESLAKSFEPRGYKIEIFFKEEAL